MKTLIEKALEARKMAYAPYSDFLVGAALECEDGTVYTGCNIENASYGATNCAERTAFFKAISEGKTSFRRIAIVGGKEGEMVAPSPCGICLQVMAEFCDSENFQVIMAKTQDDFICKQLGELLPYGFSL